MIPPAVGIAAVLGALAVTLGGLKRWQRAARPHPELVRKVAHVGMGLVTLSFPWVFAGATPVVVLCLGAAAGLASIRVVPALGRAVGSVLGGVRRASWGEIYFPAAVATVFVLSRGDRLLYLVPILLLTVADAAGALVGVFYGRTRYRTGEGGKSLEGSLAVFLASFLATHVPLLLVAEIGRPESLLIALNIAALATMLEAVAAGGADNVLLPLGGFVMLRAFLPMETAELGLALGVTAGLSVLIVGWRHRTTLRDDALLAAILAGWALWAMAGWPALVPALGLLFAYNALWPRTARGTTRPHGVAAVVSACGPSLAWALLGTAVDGFRSLPPVTFAFAAHLAFTGMAWRALRRPSGGRIGGMAVVAATAWVVVVAPALWFAGSAGLAVRWAVVGAAVVAASSAWYGHALAAGCDAPGEPVPWLRRALMAAGISALGALVLAAPG